MDERPALLDAVTVRIWLLVVFGFFFFFFLKHCHPFLAPAKNVDGLHA